MLEKDLKNVSNVKNTVKTAFALKSARSILILIQARTSVYRVMPRALLIKAIECKFYSFEAVLNYLWSPAEPTV